MIINRVIALIAVTSMTFVIGFGLIKAPEYKSTNAAEKAPSMQDKKLSQLGFDITPLTESEIQEKAKKLSPEEAKVILKKGTEPAFCGNLVDNKLDGTYICRLCDLPLFKSDSKFKSGTGWPSFFQPVDPEHVSELDDSSFGMTRTEILCARCSAHLGHVFPDGPKPTGLRFCVNSISLDFVEDGNPLPGSPAASSLKTAYFAGGCFWGVEDRFSQIPGVHDAISGYQGGDDTNPSYKEVCSGTSGHAESVEIKYDPAVVSYDELLAFFFKIHNPTQGNRQGPDYGSQYRSMIFPTDDQQMKVAQDFIDAQQKEGKWSSKKITTEIMAAPKFYKAEEYHQDYHLRNGGHCAIPE
ncbi:MAG: bifunctional methionine sulfoxide reductase B/A protein [Phycisphaerales bacterium]|nr:bifunctional methionine sulfoxide reductase B/A protein [Phycisphaerales bacterium]